MKRRRTDSEISALALKLSSDWTAGDLVFTWLRRHVAELTAMVRDQSWSWSDVARALDEAGITYRSGVPWTASFLTLKAAQARKVAASLSGASQPIPGVQHLPPPPRNSFVQTPSQPVAPGSEWQDLSLEVAHVTGPEDDFSPISAMPWPPPPKVEQPREEKPIPARPKRFDPDAVLRKLHGLAKPGETLEEKS